MRAAIFLGAAGAFAANQVVMAPADAGQGMVAPLAWFAAVAVRTAAATTTTAALIVEIAGIAVRFASAATTGAGLAIGAITIPGAAGRFRRTAEAGGNRSGQETDDPFDDTTARVRDRERACQLIETLVIHSSPMNARNGPAASGGRSGRQIGERDCVSLAVAGGGGCRGTASITDYREYITIGYI
jgi:hypothetical protein